MWSRCLLTGHVAPPCRPIAARLLGDIRSIFGARATIASADLVKALNALLAALAHVGREEQGQGADDRRAGASVECLQDPSDQDPVR